MLKAGDILDNTYMILQRIGSGGGGIIFRAKHLRMDKTVAIKLIKHNVRGVIENRAEVDILKNLKHEYLPQVLDFVEDGGDVYTVMEFIEGTDMKKLVNSGRHFTEKEVTRYTVQLCEAVEYLHSHVPPIIHSDIKPANVMLTPKGSICLIDFNISAVSNDRGGSFSIGGSKGFAAPEQFRKAADVPESDGFREETRFLTEDEDDTEVLSPEEVELLRQGNAPRTALPAVKAKAPARAYIDVRTDVYGIGATMYYLVTARIPAEGRLDFRGVKVSKRLQGIIEKAMDPDPDKRFRAVSDMKKAMNNDGGVRISRKALMIGTAAAVIIAAAAVIYVNARASLNLRDSVIVYGNHYFVEATPKDNINGAEVTDKYNATAVSVAMCIYDYIGGLDLSGIYTFLNVSDAAAAEIRTVFPEYEQTKSSLLYMYSGELGKPGDGDSDMVKYVKENYENYTDNENLSVMFDISGGEVRAVYVGDDKQIADMLPDGVWSGKCGFACTASTGQVPLNVECKSVDPENDYASVISRQRQKTEAEQYIPPESVEFGGYRYYADDDELSFRGQDLAGADMSWLGDCSAAKTVDLHETKNIALGLFPEMPLVETVRLDYSDITDLSDIARVFPNLKSLDISQTDVESMTGIDRLTSLESLDITDTLIYDLTGMENLTSLQYLSMSGTAVDDLSPLSSLTSLRTLIFERATDIADIVDAFSPRRVIDISPLKGLVNLEVLDLDSHHLGGRDIMDTLSWCTNLRELDLNNIRLPDPDGYNGESQLKDGDLRGIEKFTELECLDIGFAGITDISFVSGLEKLRTLRLAGCDEIRDISPLAGLTRLEELSFYGTNVSYYSVLEELADIRVLDIERNDFYYNISGAASSPDPEIIPYLKNMSGLEKLTLLNYNISDSDVTAMSNMGMAEHLEHLLLTGECVSGENAARLERMMPDCSISIY